MITEAENYSQLYDDLYKLREENVPTWRNISRYVGITVDEQFLDHPTSAYNNDTPDSDVEDPTAALSVFQAGDYLDGILWGSGEEAVTLEPSDWILEQADISTLKDYYDFRTKQLLRNMNHSDAAFSTARKPFLYGQVGFGTSGIGTFRNSDFPNKEENPYFFRDFGVDNIVIGEGKNGRINTVFVVYHWRVTRIMQEFGYNEEVIPKEIVDCYKKGSLTKEFTLIQGIIPREDYAIGLKGKKGTKYKGVWFTNSNRKEIFFTEDFKTLPLPVARAIKVHGKPWGKSSGTILISTIMATNYMLGQCIETIEKLNDPSLGTYNNALFGDSVVDSGAGSLATFSQEMMGNKNSPPLFKLYDVGDPTALVSFLLPYLNEKIATGMKTDILLDFASAKDMTATESMQRYAIRGKSLAGLIGQITSEMLDPTIDRCLQIEDDSGLKGVDPNDSEGAQAKEKINRSDMIMPQAVVDAIDKGKKWYKVKYNNELNRMHGIEKIEKVIQIINGITMLAALEPKVLLAVEWYDLIEDVNNALGGTYIKDKDAFEAEIKKRAELEKQAMMLAAAQQGADIQKGISQSKKDEADAKRQQ